MPYEVTVTSYGFRKSSHGKYTIIKILNFSIKILQKGLHKIAVAGNQFQLLLETRRSHDGEEETILKVRRNNSAKQVLVK